MYVHSRSWKIHPWVLPQDIAGSPERWVIVSVYKWFIFETQDVLRNWFMSILSKIQLLLVSFLYIYMWASFAEYCVSLNAGLVYMCMKMWRTNVFWSSLVSELTWWGVVTDPCSWVSFWGKLGQGSHFWHQILLWGSLGGVGTLLPFWWESQESRRTILGKSSLIMMGGQLDALTAHWRESLDSYDFKKAGLALTFLGLSKMFRRLIERVLPWGRHWATLGAANFLYILGKGPISWEENGFCFYVLLTRWKGGEVMCGFTLVKSSYKLTCHLIF